MLDVCFHIGMQKVLEQSKPEASLEAKMTKLKLFYFGHIRRRQGSLGEKTAPGKQKAAGKEDTKLRQVDSITEATSMSVQERSRAVEDRTVWTSLIHRVTSQLNSMSHTQAEVKEGYVFQPMNSENKKRKREN